MASGELVSLNQLPFYVRQKAHKDYSLKQFSKFLVQLFNLNRGNARVINNKVLEKQRDQLKRNLNHLALRLKMNCHDEDKQDLEVIQDQIIEVTNLESIRPNPVDCQLDPKGS